MEFPSRSGGAQGGLIKGNLFAQSGAPVFSHTKHGQDTIHLVNGRIQITRDAQEAPPPYLHHPYFLDGDRRAVRLGVDGETLEDRAVADGLGARKNIAGQGVFVGDGFYLDMERNPAQTNSTPVLVSLDSPEDDVVRLDVPALMDVMRGDGRGWMFPSVMATGWVDDVHRYGFAVFGVLDDGYGALMQSRYVCIVGDTGTRTAAVYDIPNLPDSAAPLVRQYSPLILEYRTGWWGMEFVYRERFVYDDPVQGGGPARCYCVGRGHLLALLVGMERLGADLDADGADVVRPYLLPAGASPYLLRSRDFGKTWSIEAAAFLTADDPPSANGGLSPDAPPDGWPATLQRAPDHSYFVASPMGGGRVAVAAHGAPQSPPAYENAGWWNYNSAMRAWRFYVSGAGGTGFANVPWPMDDMRGAAPLVALADDVNGPPSLRSFAHPTFSDTLKSARAYSFGPGHFAFAAVAYGVDLSGGTMASVRWGTYPEAYPVTVWQTRDFGNTWTSEVLPASCMPYAQGWATVKGLYSIHAGDGTYFHDLWPVRFLGLSYWLPATADKPPMPTVLRFDIDGAAPLFAGFDPLAPIGSLEEVGGLGPVDGVQGVPNPEDPSVLQRAVRWEAPYTGHFKNAINPEAVYLGYDEFEAPT